MRRVEMTRGLWAGLGLLILIAACSDKTVPATAIVVSVKSNLGTQLSTVEVEVLADASGEQGSSTRLSLDEITLPAAVAITKGTLDTVTVVVRGLDAEDATLVSQRAKVTFRDRTTLRLPVFLGSVCLGSCPDTATRTCTPRRTGTYLAGECTPVPSYEGSDLTPVEKAGEEHDWSVPVAGGPGECVVGAPFMGECDPLQECGCEDGEMCIVRATSEGDTVLATTVCVTEGGIEAGQNCSDEVEACVPGTSCVGNLCKPLCTSDDDCDSDVGPSSCLAIYVGGIEVPGVRTCQIPCEFDTGKGCAPSSVCALTGDNPECAVPLTECPASYMDDGVCDESEGTRLCPDGSDPIDCPPNPSGCVIPSPPAGDCELVSQCGCAADEACIIDNDSYLPHCAPESGTLARGAQCGGGRGACTAGLICLDRACQPFCHSDADCDDAGPMGGRCVNVPDGNSSPLTGVRACLIRCDPTGADTCTGGMVCQDAVFRAVCRYPSDPCPWESDGECDEPEGTRLCVDGTDPADCGG